MQKEYRARVSMRNPVHFLALGFGSGLVPFMPGTFGSLAAVPLIYFSANLPVALFITFTLVASVVGIYLCGKTATTISSCRRSSCKIERRRTVC